MLIFYVDESGSHAGETGLFTLSAVGIHDSSRRPLAESLVALRHKHFGDLASEWAASEIKGRYLAMARASLFAGTQRDSETSAYRSLDSTTKLHDLERDLAVLFATFRPIVIAVTIEKARIEGSSPTDSLGYAYAFLQRRIALILKRLHPSEAAVLVADQQGAHEKYFDTGDMVAFRRSIDKAGGRKAPYELILDKPLWIDSKLSSWDREIIQLADIVAFEARELVATGSRTTTLWPEIYRCLAVDIRRGDPDGEGFVIFPMPGAAHWPITQP